MDEFFGGALEKMKGMQETAVQGVLPLRVSKLQIEQAAMTFNHGEAVEFTVGVAIGHGAEMPPVSLTLHARRRFEADDGLSLFGGVSHALQVIPHDGDTALKALCFKALANDHGRGLAVDLHQTGDLLFEGIELAGAGEAGARQAGSIEVLVHRPSSDTQGPRDFAHREALMSQAVDVKDGAFVKDGRLPRSGG